MGRKENLWSKARVYPSDVVFAFHASKRTLEEGGRLNPVTQSSGHGLRTSQEETEKGKARQSGLGRTRTNRLTLMEPLPPPERRPFLSLYWLGR